MSDTTNIGQRTTRLVDRAVHHIEEAMGSLNGAAQVSGDGHDFHQATYDLARVITRVREAAARVRS